MAAQKGKDLLVKIHDGASYVTVAGLRSRRIAFNAETVDITHAESAGRWRELLEGAGVKRASIAGRGLFKDEATDALVRQAFFDGAVKNCQIVIPDLGTITGAFQIVEPGVCRRAQRRGDLRAVAGVGRCAGVCGGVACAQCSSDSGRRADVAAGPVGASRHRPIDASALRAVRRPWANV